MSYGQEVLLNVQKHGRYDNTLVTDRGKDVSTV
jgi:hypothetical protein